MLVSENLYSRIFYEGNGLNGCHFFVAGSVNQVADSLIDFLIYLLLSEKEI